MEPDRREEGDTKATGGGMLNVLKDAVTSVFSDKPAVAVPSPSPSPASANASADTDANAEAILKANTAANAKTSTNNVTNANVSANANAKETTNNVTTAKANNGIVATAGKELSKIIQNVTTIVSPTVPTAPTATAPTAPEEEANASEAEAEAPVIGKPAQKKRVRREIVPTDSLSFFKARSKDVSKFKFTSEGNLLVPSMGGEAAKTIQLSFVGEATPDEKREIDMKRKETILEIEQEYDELSRQLSTALDEWKSSGDSTDAIRLQKELLALDSRRTSLRSPIRWSKTFKNPSIKEIQVHETAVVDEKFKDLKLGYPVMTLIVRNYTFTQEYPERKEAPKKAVQAVPSEGKEETFIIFSSPEDPEYGLLSPETPLEFVYNTTKYNSILQAYHVERATQLGRGDMRATILKTVNPKTIRTIGSRIVGKESKENDMPLELLKDIVKSLILQDPRFTPLLRKTGTDTLIYAEPKDKILGVGLSIDDEEAATNSSRWNGALNLLGQAWESVRKTLPEQEIVQSGGAVLESGRTIQDVKKARSKVLMGYYRRKG